MGYTAYEKSSERMFIMEEEIVIIQNGELTAAIALSGSQLRSLKDKNGKEYIWRADPAVWPKSAPIMFPICGGLKNDAYVYGGKTYTLPKHGFSTDCVYTVEEKTEDAVTLRITDSEKTREMYPFGFVFRTRFALVGGTLVISYSATNTGSETLYYADGAHEGYACPEGIEAYDVVFEKEETLLRTVLDGNLLEPTELPVETDGKVLHMKYSHMNNDCLNFNAINSRSVKLINRQSGKGVQVDFADFRHFVLWTKQNAPYLCVEPWNGRPDMIDADGILEHKPSMFALAAGETLTHTHSVTPIL